MPCLETNVRGLLKKLGGATNMEFISEKNRGQQNQLLKSVEREPIDVLTDGMGTFRVTWKVKSPDIFLVVKVGEEFHTMKVWEGSYERTKRYWCTNKKVMSPLKEDVVRRARFVVHKLNTVIGG
jgi:hypothetical protein